MDNKIDRDELTGAAANIDSVLFILQEVVDDYFEKLDAKDESCRFSILWDWARYRAYTHAAYLLLNSVKKDFEKNHITAYSDKEPSSD